ncbi:hypothetical protein PRZ48_005202 [Zasmidium cellare]|uniref:non-specific serine/threonine protein kinase n=1 Tax=Zasmidium cellare TaxID=395010 RepID=A0ABR0ERS6_ZASCE|nr:hypothetical protein PRZ48_005202 [Zasmidium cellare]
MFGPPFRDPFGGMGMNGSNGFGNPMMPPRRRQADGGRAPLGGGQGVNMPGGFPGAGGRVRAGLEGMMGGRATPGGFAGAGGRVPAGLEGLMGGRATPGGFPGARGQVPAGLGGMMGGLGQGGHDPRGGFAPPRAPRGGGQGVGRVFDPTRAQRGQPNREAHPQGRRPGIPRQGGAKYEKIKALTPGGMSESVTIVRSRYDGKLYVEKRVRTDGQHRKRTAAEIQALKAVKGHPNLNRLIEYEVKANGLCSIFLEYCDGGSLDKRIATMASQGGHFSEASVWHVLHSVSKALAYMHSGVKDERDQPPRDWNTIAHLDLKPQNIFISSEGQVNGQNRVVVADFGCAVTFADLERGREDERRQPCGTPGWYPPEGMAGNGYGVKTDIWMLGGTIQVLCLLIQAPHRPALASPTPCGRRYGAALQHMVKQLTDGRLERRPSARNIVSAAARGLGGDMRGRR